MSILVRAFTDSEFHSALSNRVASPEEVASLRPAQYLYGYLNEIGAKTILVEDPYTDADFLDDYTAYYARCFSSYSRRCKRLHFFRSELTQEAFRDLLRTPPDKASIEALQGAYLGFVVARPLPQAVIGRTVVKPYDDDSRRRFPVARSYTVNLVGIELEIEGPAFQEQDTVLAACATVALWSAFHKTSTLFGTAIPAPATVTRAATQSAHYGRPIPQHGLRVEEICSAIRHNGLDPEVVDLTRKRNVAVISLIHGYIRMGLPVILIVAIPGKGWHAITLTGVSVNESAKREEVPGTSKILPMIGRKIDRLYGHDDQIGPYARLTVENATPNKHSESPVRLKSSWEDAAGEPYLYPIALSIPVYNKIRLTFLEVQGWVTPLHTVIAELLPNPVDMEWDIHLILSNELKKIIGKDATLDSSVREDLLIAHHPRFWWRAVLRYQGLKVCDLLFDATGIARSFPLTTVIWRVENVAVALEKSLSDPAKTAAIKRMLRSDRYFNFLANSLSARKHPGTLLSSVP